MIGGKAVSIRLSEFWILVTIIGVGVFIGVTFLNFAGTTGVFILLLILAIAVGIAQQTLP